MTTIQALLLLACLACLSPPTSSECGVRHWKEESSRIIGGGISSSGKWPWQVFVVSTDMNNDTYVCGGTLVSRKHIITAAHCHEGKTIVYLSGKSINKNNLIPRKINKFILHPRYSTITLKNDIAVIVLKKPAIYNEYLSPICMPDTNDDFAGRMAWATGWGKTKNGLNGLSVDLREVEIPILDNQVCKDILLSAGGVDDLGKGIPEHLMCAGNGKKGVYKGDSGGPLMVENDIGRWTLVGVTSSGVIGSKKNIPDFFTRITYFMPWLQSIIDNLEFRSQSYKNVQ